MVKPHNRPVHNAAIVHVVRVGWKAETNARLSTMDEEAGKRDNKKLLMAAESSMLITTIASRLATERDCVRHNRRHGSPVAKLMVDQ